MIIDDDEDVHSTTTFALGNRNAAPPAGIRARLFGRPGASAKHESDIAVILLDVVMEQDDAGLHWCATSAKP
jgi:hypothetical protein